MSLYSTAVSKLFDAVVIAASESASSQVIDCSLLRGDEMALQLEITGDGTCKATYTCSLDGVTFSVFDGVSGDIKTSMTKSSGASGKILINFSIKPTEYLKITITETGTSNSVTVTGYLLTR